MSKDNLIFFPKKSKRKIDMTNSEAKWMTSGSLLLVLTMAAGINSSLFSQKAQTQTKKALASKTQNQSRSIASIRPVFKVSWEKKAFETLKNSRGKDLTGVGESPNSYDHFTFGDLGGKYQVHEQAGRVTEVQLADQNLEPKTLEHTQSFLEQNLSLFSGQASKIKKINAKKDSNGFLEDYQLLSDLDQSLGRVHVLLDENKNLISIKNF